MKALPKRLCIGIGGHFGPCYGVTLKKGRLTYTYSSGDSSSREPEPPLEWPLKPYPQPEEIRVSPQQWRNFRRTLDRLTSGAGNVITWILPSATGPIGPLKSFTRIDRSSGDNCFPGRDGRAIPITEDGTDNTFEKFCRAVARLDGREFH